MSIATAITDFKSRINAIYDVLEEKDAEMPEKKDTYSLPQTIESVPMSLDAKEEYTMVRRSDGVKSFYLIESALSADTIPGLSDAVEVKLGTGITDIASGVFSDCTSLTSVTIRNKTWQDAIDNSYWGISDPNIMHGDWDKYLSFANAQNTASTVKLQANGSAPEIHLLSSSGADDWQSYDLTSDIQLTNYGDRIFLKAETINEQFASSTTNYWRFIMTGKLVASGNIMSLLNAENELLEINTSFCFYRLFYYASSLIKAPALPAIKLSNHCYNSMFLGCSNLIQIPNLPAKHLKTACYVSMFQSCTNLSIAMKCLPAIELEDSCYTSMFAHCSKLSIAPELPATTLVSRCYENMFKNCVLLSNLKVAFTEWNTSNAATTNWLLDASKNVSETTFICPNQLDVSTRSNNTIPEDTGTHTWNIQPTLDPMMAMLEDYPKFKDQLPAISSDIFIDYMLNDKASDNTVCNTRALVEEKQDMLSTINTPWTILGYNKTIPQYVKYRRKNYKGTYDYLYVSSVDDTTVDATVDGIKQTIAIKHGFENAQLIDENDQTGLLRPIVAGCKTYTRNNENLPFGETSQFITTDKLVQSISEDIAKNIEAKDGRMHTYGNNNPYDCPASIVVDGKRYRFCGYTVTIQSKHLLTTASGTTYYDTARFDAPELNVAEAFNRYEDGKEYYKRNGTSFAKMTIIAGDPIFEEEVYEKDGGTMLCKSAYVQANYTYNIDSAVGTLITDPSAVLSNNFYMDGANPTSNYGCNKWSQSDVRVFMNSKFGSNEFKTTLAAQKKNPFEKNSAIAPQTTGMSNGNGLLLKFAKDNEFMKFICPSVNRSSVFDKQYNTYNNDGRWKGSFVAYKNLEDSSCSTSGKKVNRTHDIDNLFLISYTEAGFTNENGNFDKNEATSNFTDVYSTNADAGNLAKRLKYKYESNGSLSPSSYIWWLRSVLGSSPQYAAYVTSTGTYSYYYAFAGYRLSPACTLY